MDWRVLEDNSTPPRRTAVSTTEADNYLYLRSSVSTNRYSSRMEALMKCSDCGANLKPIVAIDIDGTVAQYHYSFMEFLERWLPTQFIGGKVWHWSGLGEFSDHLGLEKHVYQQAKLAFRAGGNKRWMHPFPGAVEFMQNVSRLKVEVWITTTRPWLRMDNIDPDTREWLRRFNIKYDHILFDEDKYGTLVTLVDPGRIVMVLDDEDIQVKRCESLALPSIHRRTRFNEGVPERFGPTQTMSGFTEIFDVLVERVGAYYALQS